MTDQELQRRVRGRVRRLRQKRRRQRMAVAGAIAIAGFAIFASLSINLIKRERVRVLPPVVQTYAFPGKHVVLAQAEPQSEKKSSRKLLDLDKLFPLSRKKRSSPQQMAQNDQDQEPPPDVVILDDLRAAPPKSMYLEAIFQTSQSASRDPLPAIELSIDYTNSIFPTTSGPTGSPVVPEPGTGVLLGLGLGGISVASRRRRRKIEEAAAACANRKNH